MEERIIVYTREIVFFISDGEWIFDGNSVIKMILKLVAYITRNCLNYVTSLVLN